MSDTLTIKDNRTGKEYDIDIVDGNISAMQLRQIKVNEGDFGMMSYDKHCQLYQPNYRFTWLSRNIALSRLPD